MALTLEDIAALTAAMIAEMSAEEIDALLEDFAALDPTDIASLSGTEADNVAWIAHLARCRAPVKEVQRLATIETKAYAGIIRPGFAKPLSAFLRAIGNQDCPELMFDFLKSPFLTARTAGLPYAAALALGSGDWEWVMWGLMAENNQRKKVVNQITNSIGPVWVKAT